jgi:hypothetical protein
MTLKTFDVGTRPQLAIDHLLFVSWENVVERLHGMRKRSTPVLMPEAPWERPGEGALWGPINAQVDDETGQVKLWYQSFPVYPGLGDHTGTALRCYASSPDGIVFQRPELGLFEVEGSAANNVTDLRDGPGPEHGTIDSARIDPSEPPQFRYKSVTWQGRDAEGFGTHGVAFSADGMRWRNYEHNPVIRGRQTADVSSSASLRDWFDPASSPAYPSGKYALFPKVGLQVGAFRRRSFAVSFSEDEADTPFTRFTDPQLVLAADQRDDDMAEDRLAAARSILLYDDPADHRCEFYGVQVFRCGDVFLGLLWVYDASFELSRLGRGNQYALVEVQLVASRDLIHWRRVGGRQPVIPRGDPDAFDSHMIFYHSLPVQMQDEWWIYYVGFNEGHAARNGYDEPRRQKYWDDVRAGRRHLPSIGLATVRREGFAAFEAGAQAGRVTTRPLRPGGAELRLNAVVSDGGEIRVEVQTADGRPLPGFATGACTPLAADGLRQAVRWGERSGDASWPQQDLRLEFHLRHASLYAFAFE